jgi:RHS repeat-associated protein
MFTLAVSVALGLLSGSFPAWALNENESVGFQSNHAFESGQFGENIDVLNGGLNLSIPIGPRYAVNDTLSYGLTLSYGSKIYRADGIDGSNRLAGIGNAGLGFVLNLGRIYRDVRPAGNSGDCKWYYVSPDGNQHPFEDDNPSSSCDDVPDTGSYSIDGTFYQFGHASFLNWDGTPASAPTLSITTPDGIVFSFAHLVQVNYGAGHLEGGGQGFPGTDEPTTRYNADFGGWYVTRITSTRSDSSTNFVNVNYESQLGYEHVIRNITDSLGRVITFTNECQPAATNTHCVEETPGVPSRAAIRTIAVSVPAFHNSQTIDTTADQNNPGTIARYTLAYDWQTVTSHWTSQNSLVFGPVNLLTRIDFPLVTNHAGIQMRYATTFSYGALDNGTIDNGEVVQRVLPFQPAGDGSIPSDNATVQYAYQSYGYLASVPESAAPNVVSETRNVVTKSITINGELNPPAWTWTYDREGTTSGNPLSNPLYVVVTDPLGNDTIYRYLASRDDLTVNPPDPDTENGWSPEWNDGVNYIVEYYQGQGASRRLVRTIGTDYDADRVPGKSYRGRMNVRTTRQVTTYIDDNSKTATIAKTGWDNMGHWKSITESGDGIQGTRRTRSEYLGRDPARFLMREVSDGSQVISRIENQYDPNGMLVLTIQRLTLPSVIGQPATPALPIINGDVLTTYTYHTDGTGNLDIKQVGNQGISGLALISPAYQIEYTWTGGGYLAKKQFYDWQAHSYFPWYAIDRVRDGNTGLISRTTDTAGVDTTYLYDQLGRLTDIQPTLPEYPTQIEYVDFRHATVRQGSLPVMGSNYNCAIASGDFLMTCYEYDALGRLTKTQKRPADSTATYPFQTIGYNILGWKTLESEWRTGDPFVGTAYLYTDPLDNSQSDPFGRVRKVVTADSKETETRYFGLTSAVTVKGVSASDGTLFDATTTYERDGWGRLVSVYAPVAGLGQGGGGDAHYTYDSRDNLIAVALVDRASNLEQVRRFEYDPLNRLLNSYNPEAGSQSIVGYDVLGNVTDSVDASGTHIISAYDGAGRLTSLYRQDYQKPGGGAPPIVQILSNTYDQIGVFGQAGGKVTTTQDFDDTNAWVHTTERYYGGLNGRSSSERHFFDGWSSPSDPVAVAYTYNPFGQIDTLTYPEGPAGKGGAFSILNKYSNGYPTEVWDPSLPMPPTQGAEAQATVTYNAAGGIAVVTTHGSMSTTVDSASDARWRPKSIMIGKSDGSRTDYASGAYTYDGAGNIAAIGSSQYGYDAANRLVRAFDTTDGTIREQAFQYDDFGNMVQKNQYDINHMLVRSDLYQTAQLAGTSTNRIASHQIDSNPASTYSTDPRGNVIQGDSQTFEIDARNRVVALHSIASGQLIDIAAYGYDSGANRVRKLDVRGDLWTYYVRDGPGRLLSEFRRTRSTDYTPEWVKHNIYIGDRLVGLKENMVPAPPGRITATVNRPAHTVTLSWTPPPSGEGYIIANYKVYRSLNTSPPSWSVQGSPGGPSFVNTVTNNTTYRYAITAVDTTGKEGYGVGTLVVLAGDILLPNTPTGLAGAAGDRRVNLSWNANGSSELVVGYHVYRGVGTGSAIRITQVPMNAISPTASTITFVDQGLSNGTTYRYSISAVDSSSLESTRSSEVSLVPSDFTPPDPPRRVHATSDCVGGSAVTVSWEPSPNPEPVSYTIFRTPPFGGPPPLQTFPSQATDSTSFLDTDTTTSTAYTYTIKTIDSASNLSVPSQAVSVTTRAPNGQVPVPLKPYAVGGDGKVTLNIVQTLGSDRTRIYRKRNVDQGCSAYEYLDETQIDGSFTDATVQNGVSWEYALTNLDSSGNESAFSPVALAVPTSMPTGLTACIEELPAEAERSTTCSFPGTHWTPYRRFVVRWTGWPDGEYEPLSDHSEGALGYLKGIRFYRHTTQTGSSNTDQSTLVPVLDDYHKYYCASMPDVVCKSAPQNQELCPTVVNDACLLPDDGGGGGLTNDGLGNCAGGGGNCMVDGDCLAGETCSAAPPDAALLMYGEDSWKGEFSVPANTFTCLAARAVYKVYENGHWRTVESGLAGGIANPSGASPYDRCNDLLKDVCDSQALIPVPGHANFNICPDESTLPRAPDAPTLTSTASGTLTVTWNPPSGTGNCALYTPASCVTNACPPSQTQPQYCSISDGNRCRLAVPQICNTDQDCPRDPQDQVEVCVQNTANVITGYRVYLTELDPERHHFVRPAHIATVNGSTTSYVINGLSDYLRVNTQTEFYARVATIDQFGRASDPSPASATVPVTPSSDNIKPPNSLKVIVWSDNDAGSDDQGNGKKVHPRGIDGVKLTWKDRYSGGAQGTVYGYRVWRLMQDGTWCALLQQGTQANPNPPGVTVCTNEVTGQVGDPNAYSTYYTTGPGAGNTYPGYYYPPNSTSGDRVHVDMTVLPGVAHTYAVSVCVSAGDSARSASIQGIAYPHPVQPLSPPANLIAYAPSGSDLNGIYLRWCKSEPIEAVDHYKVYRSHGPNNRQGPFALLATLPASCLDQHHRCEIHGPIDPVNGGSVTQPAFCTSGYLGTCKVVDLTFSSDNGPNGHPASTMLYTTQVTGDTDHPNGYTYNYVATAVRNAGQSNEQESAYSEMNMGWLNYCDANGNNCSTRYDPDNPQDIPCGDETALLESPAVTAAATTQTEESGLAGNDQLIDEAYSSDSRSSPLRTIGSTSDLPSAPNASPRFVYLHLDHLGSARVITDASGNVVSTHHYMPFGEEMPSVTQGGTNKRQFTGHERDPESGLDYMMARYYSPVLSRFIATDPGAMDVKISPQSWNLYSYVRNRPIVSIDRDGRNPIIVAGVLILAGIAIYTAWMDVVDCARDASRQNDKMKKAQADLDGEAYEEALHDGMADVQRATTVMTEEYIANVNVGMQPVFPNTDAGNKLADIYEGLKEMVHVFMGMRAIGNSLSIANVTITQTAVRTSHVDQNGNTVEDRPASVETHIEGFGSLAIQQGQYGHTLGGLIDNFKAQGMAVYIDGLACP